MTANNPRNFAILVNPRAGKGRAVRTAEKILHHFDHLKINYRHFAAQWPESFQEYTEVILVGGDGTINYFLNRYRELDKPVTLFKGGSGNDFYFKLYGRLGLKENLSIAVCGKTEAIDAGECNGRIFINGFGIGFDGRVVRAMEGRSKLSAGYFAYLFIVLRFLLFYRESFFCLQYNNKVLASKYFLITVANASRYGGGFMVSPLSILNDGALNLVLVEKISPVQRLLNLHRMKKGTHLQKSFVHNESLSSIRIKNPSRQFAHIDGELLIDAQFEIRVLKQKFIFRVPGQLSTSAQASSA